MKWVTPKTDWKASDYFSTTDYNRIVGNLLYLKEYAQYLYKISSYKDMETEKTYISMLYADEINNIEDNLELLDFDTYSFDFGEKPVYKANGNTPTYDEWNRIESAILKIYKSLKTELVTVPVLEFTLGLDMEV